MKKMRIFNLFTAATLGLTMAAIAADSPSTADTPVAKVGDVTLTQKQMMDDISLGIYSQESAMYQMKQDWINQQARNILFDKAAKEAKQTRKAWEAKELNVAPPTEGEIDEFVRRAVPANQIPTNPAQLTALRQRVTETLVGQKKTQKEQEVYQRLAAKNPVQVLITPPAPPVVKVPKNAPVKGPETAKVVVFEYTDFQCPWCKRSQDNVKEMEKNFGSQVKMVDRMFPLIQIHPRAMPSAEAAYCAKEQGKYWEYRDKLFESSPNLEDADFKRIAKEVGLKQGKFEKCLKDHTYKSQIDADMAEGAAAGVRGTPSFFVNGVQANFQQLSDIVRNELAKVK